jgi:hypothetical protein
VAAAAAVARAPSRVHAARRAHPAVVPRGDLGRERAVTTIGAWGRRARWRATSRAGGTRLFLAASRLDRDRAVVGAGTELVLEGFPRSANTFAAVAFQSAQPRPVRLAHHLHARGQILRAVGAGIPAIVLVRDPAEAVASLVMRAPHLTLRDALRGYARFYTPLIRCRDDVVIGRFADVTSDFGRVIDEVNARFGTRFARFEHDDANVADVYRLIELRTKQPTLARAIDRFTSGELGRDDLLRARRAAGDDDACVPEHRVARPSATRSGMLAGVAAELNRPDLRPDLRRARDVYAAFAQPHE